MFFEAFTFLINLYISLFGLVFGISLAPNLTIGGLIIGMMTISVLFFFFRGLIIDWNFSKVKASK